MGLMDFIKKQFSDILQWTEEGDGVLAWRFPMADNEIQYGASLTVRESQMAVFVNEGKVADVFGPGMYKLTTQTLPVLTYLKNWDKLFESPFKSDLYFFSTRQQIDQRWGTSQPVTIRDKDFGAVRLRAFGNYAYRIADAKAFYTEVSGTRDRYTVDELDGQLRGLMLQHISDAVAASGVPFLDLAANQVAFAQQLKDATAPAFAKLGLALEGVTLQSVSLPEELQKILDRQTDPWGIKVGLVELKHVDLPQEMQRAMARQAEAERERRAKIITAEGEFQASAKLAEAAAVIGREPAAIQLRFLGTLTEIAADHNSTIVFPVPIDLIRAFADRKPA